MEAAAILRILSLIDTAVVMWTEHENDEADLFALRDAMADMSPEEKLAFLQSRADQLQERADDLRDR